MAPILEVHAAPGPFQRELRVRFREALHGRGASSRSAVPLAGLLAVLVGIWPGTRASAESARAAAPPPSPNILLVIADDLGVDQVGIYGEGPSPPSTPHLDSLARRGVLFRNAWSYPVCSSTRATILTGRYGLRTGLGWVATPGRSLPDREITLPELLARHPRTPYEVAAIGKWHLHGGEMWERDPAILSGPARAGFPYFRGVFQYIALRYDRWRELEVHDLGEGGLVINHERIVERYNTTEIVDRAEAWITATEKRVPEAPWFLWLAFNAAHSPFHRPPAELHSVDLSSGDVTCANPYPFRSPGRLVPCYRAMVEAMDHELGRLLELVAPRKRVAGSRDTIVVFVGDNGTPKEASTGDFHPMHAKGTPYEGGVNVPLVVAGPGVVGGGGGKPRESDALVVTADLFATVLELAGMDVSASVPSHYPSTGSAQRRRAVVLDSHSLLPTLEGETDPAPREYAYTELFGAGHGNRIWPHARAIRDRAGYKLVRFPSQRQIQAHDELYHLPSDPFERSDLLRGELSPEQRRARDALSRALLGIRQSGWKPTGPAAP